MQIENVIIEYRDRPEGSESKLDTYSDGMKVLRTILRLFRHYKPLSFFGAISCIMILAAAIFFVPVFADYLDTGKVERFPTLIVCGFMAIAAIQSFFSGLILSNLLQKDKRDFEYQLRMVRDEKNRKSQI